MTTISEQQAKRLLADIKAIKSIINENRPLMQQLLLPVHFRIVSLVAGLLVIGISAVYYGMISHYGSYAGVPETCRMLMGIAAVIAYIVVGALKRFLWMRSVKKLDQHRTLRQTARDFYRAQIIHVILPHFGLMAFLGVFLIVRDMPYYLVPLISIGLGVFYNTIGSVAKIPQYLATGYWLIFSGILPLLWSDVSPFIYLSLSLGCGMLLFAAIGRSTDPGLQPSLPDSHVE